MSNKTTILFDKEDLKKLKKAKLNYEHETQEEISLSKFIMHFIE